MLQTGKNMIIKTTLIPSTFDAITVFPFILMRPEWASNPALVAHEMVHYKEQKSSWVIPWLLRYAFSKKFRFEAEVRGYQAQISMGGISVDQAAKMLTKYGFDVTEVDCVAELTKNS